MKRQRKSISKLIRLARRVSYIKALRFGVAAAIEHEAWLQAVRPGLVVDIGANRGQFSLVCRRVNPESEIVAFEPLSSAADVFRRVFAGDARVRLVQAAIGTADEIATMHVSTREDSSSLLPIGEAQVDVFAGTEESHTCEVPVAPLDKFISSEEVPERSLLKIDVQGFEKEVLEGSNALLARFEHVYVECSFIELYVGQPLITEIIELLLARGFVLAGIYNVHLDNAGRAVQADCHFTRR